MQLVNVQPAGRVPVWKPLKPSDMSVAAGERGEEKRRAQRVTPKKAKKIDPFFKNSLTPSRNSVEPFRPSPNGQGYYIYNIPM